MIKKEDVIPGYCIVVNSKRNVLVPSKIGISVHKTFGIGENFWIEPGTKITCLSRLKSHPLFSGKVVDIEIDGKQYSTFWMELRIQTDSVKELRRKKLDKINK